MIDPREFGVTGKDLRRLADAFYTPGDDRLEPVGTSHHDRVEAGRLRSRIRDLADALDRLPPLPPPLPVEPEPVATRESELAPLPANDPRRDRTPINPHPVEIPVNPHPDPNPTFGPPPWAR